MAQQVLANLQLHPKDGFKRVSKKLLFRILLHHLLIKSFWQTKSPHRNRVQASCIKSSKHLRKKTLIHLDEHNGSTVYKLMLGVFNSKRDASYFRNDLRKDNLDGLIKDLSLMG